MLTLLELRNRAYQLMDEGQSQYLGIPEMNNYINNAAALLHNTIADGDPWRVKEEAFQGLLAGQHVYLVPTDMRNMLRLFYVGTNGKYLPIKSYNPSQYRHGTRSRTCGLAPFRYHLMRNAIRIDPAPTVADGSMLVMWYVPQYIPLVADTDSLPYYQLSGQEQWIINSAVIYAKTKEEVNSADLQMINQQIMGQIEKSLLRRDANSGNRILDDDEMLEAWYH
jgi:hypothetical protein